MAAADDGVPRRGLVYVAAFGLDEGESIGALLDQGPAGSTRALPVGDGTTPVSGCSALARWPISHW